MILHIVNSKPTTAADTADDKLCNALSASKTRAPEIIGLLHSAYHDGAHLPAGRVAERLASARHAAEQLLVAILSAEQALAAEGPSAA